MKLTNPFNLMDKATRANIYAMFLLKAVSEDALIECFGKDFCETMDGVIKFNLYETNKQISDVSSIKFYECKSGRGNKTLISRIKFK